MKAPLVTNVLRADWTQYNRSLEIRVADVLWRALLGGPNKFAGYTYDDAKQAAAEVLEGCHCGERHS
jgi:hypothetical protein